MKVKNIMFSGFAAAILMGVAAEANAATAKVVASKGYVDAVTGELGNLGGAAQGKTNLVEAVNVKLDPVQAAGETLEDGKYFKTVTQSTDGQVAVEVADLAQQIASDVKIAPTTQAVYEAIQGVTYQDGVDIEIGEDNKLNATYRSLDYESTADAADNANKLTDGYAVSYVSQVDGKVKIGAKQYTQNVDATSAAGDEGKNAPSTAAVWNAIQDSAYDDTELAGRVTANEGNITSLQSDKEDKSNKTDTINAQSTSTQYPSAAAVYSAIQDSAYDDTELEGRVSTAENDIDALQQEVDAIPVMPAACQAPNVVCVLSSEGGDYMWSVLAQPYTYTSGSETTITNGLTAQKQSINTNVN